VTTVDHQRLFAGWADVLSHQDWDRLGDFVNEDAVFEYPQMGETFRGLANIRGQFENHPALEGARTEAREFVAATEYVMTPRFTVVAIDGAGNRGTAVYRAVYADGSRWWVVNIYELRDGRVSRSRSFFAPELAAPDWRAPFREER
jgi:ketosteroid isomerase-like protein